MFSYNCNFMAPDRVDPTLGRAFVGCYLYHDSFYSLWLQISICTSSHPFDYSGWSLCL